MEFNKLGNSNIKVSKICLGTMTWGYQNNQTEAHEQIEYAISQGINFIDTAELYAVPPSPKTYGKTEQMIGNWLLNNKGTRDKIIIASKVTGPGISYIREGIGLTKYSINSALENSLKRLKTDYIDLYQIHWPQRKLNIFGIKDFHPNWFQQDDYIEQTLEILVDLVKQGKIRMIGLSNESPWGAMAFLRASEKNPKLPKIMTIQNVYNLISRVLDIGLSEVMLRENLGLLAYSPLAGGLLTGKYRNGKKPKGARFSTWGAERMQRYLRQKCFTAVDEYCNLANESGIKPLDLALGFVNSRKFLTSTIIGATSIKQLKECINSINIKISAEVINKIDKIHLNNINPGL